MKLCAITFVLSLFLPRSVQESISGGSSLLQDPPAITQPSYNEFKYPTAKATGHYNVWKCPDVPPDVYPIQWPAHTVLSNWQPNETVVPTNVHQGICFFDYENDMAKAWNYLERERPFIVRNTPDFIAAAKRWNHPGFLDNLLGNTKYPVHKSASHEFKYWSRIDTPPEGWIEPSQVLRIPYREYRNLISHTPKENGTHYYLYAEGYWSVAPEEDHFRFELFNELERFKPGQPPELFMENFGPKGPPDLGTHQKLHCKIGQAGNMAVMHFDSSRNTIVLLRGQRRYLLADPSQCEKLNLHQSDHPSSRHTSLDFSNFPVENDLQLNEVVMNPGDTLILPSYWFHSIIGLSEETAQCNVWSMPTMTHKKQIEKCGEFSISLPTVPKKEQTDSALLRDDKESTSDEL